MIIKNGMDKHHLIHPLNTSIQYLELMDQDKTI